MVPALPARESPPGRVNLLAIRRQHVVHHVIDGDSTDEMVVLVDDGNSDKVVGGEIAGHVRQRGVRSNRVDAGVQQR